MRSARHYDAAAEIHVACFGSLSPLLAATADDVGARVHRYDAEDPKWMFWLKWIAVRRLHECLPEHTILMDNDTFVLGALSDFVDCHARHDICGRLDPGCERGAEERWVGNTRIRPVMWWPTMDAICSAVGARPLDIINVGFVLFANGSMRKFAGEIDSMYELEELWRLGELPYPCANRRIVDQIAATIAVGMLDASFHPISELDVPYFFEVAAETGGGRRPVVVHTWDAWYRDALTRYLGPQALASFDQHCAQGVGTSVEETEKDERKP
ncbi:hypothetical protein LVJ94_34495 [Pendulispora rubella]|uniref:Hexosyltransferase n=1 Tax=Pendulispora rubella TaxID=2741070 RepID=A0ABZ2KYF0_9BACT